MNKTKQKSQQINHHEVKLLIFDMDGTVFQPIKSEFETIKKALLKLGWDVNISEEEVRKYIGETSEQAYQRMLPPDKASKWEVLAEEVRKYRNSTISKYGKAFPEVIKTLKTLKKRNYKLAMYTNSSVKYFELVVPFLGVEKYFDYIECTEENKLSKIELVRKIKGKLSESKAAVIGDRIHDVEAAKRNNALSIGCLYGYGKNEPEEADITINNFSELLDIFDRKLIIFEKILADFKKRKQKDKSFVIGITGIDLAGKTEFAKSFEKFLISRNYRVQVINLDDFHNPKEIRYSGKNQVDNYYTKCFDINTIIEKLLMPIHQRKNIVVKLVLLNLYTNRFEVEKQFVFGRNTIVIFEGIFLFRKEFSPYLDYKIFLEIPFEESKNRAIIRDTPIFGEGLLKRYNEKYLPTQKKYLKEFSPLKTADVIINNSNWEHPIIK